MLQTGGGAAEARGCVAGRQSGLGTQDGQRAALQGVETRLGHPGACQSQVRHRAGIFIRQLENHVKFNSAINNWLQGQIAIIDS